MKKIRYAVVGLGHIAQSAILPAFKNAKQNSELTALISSDAKKLKSLGKKYGVKKLYNYEQYRSFLRSGEVDAVYIALPNNEHQEYSQMALEAGVHVLCEKPMEVTSLKCRMMIDAAKQNKAKLMIAYRLHFEEANLKAIQLLNSGKIGELRIFNSVFNMPAKEGNIRTLPENKGGGPLYDIGIYCINATRYLFKDEPIEVSTICLNSGKKAFQNIEDTFSVTMRFPKNRIAQFACSFDAAKVSSYQVIGTKGNLLVENAYGYVGPKTHKLTIKDKSKNQVFKARDQFGPELVYFSNCILKNKEPEPSGIEGLKDIMIIEAIFEAARTGKKMKLNLDQLKRERRPTLEQEITKPAIEEPEIIDAEAPSKGEAA